MNNAIERIKGYCTEVNQAQWEELVRVADEVGVGVGCESRKDGPCRIYRYAEYHYGELALSKGVHAGLIPFPDFIAKLRGGEEWTPKAGEMVEVSRNGEVWIPREFVTKSKGRFIVWSNADEAVDFPLCRQAIPTITRAEAEAQLGKRIID